jgi:TonB family protein
MKKPILFLTIVLFQVAVHAQTGVALKYFNKGLTYFEKEQYKKADSLFSLSINAAPSIDAYYNLALTKHKLGDSVCCCLNFKNAADLGDFESYKLFDSYCTLYRRYYNEGVKFFNDQKYDAADSLFNLSLKERKNRKAFFDLAMLKLIKGDTCEYCKNIKEASRYGNKEARNIFTKSCCIFDTIKILDTANNSNLNINYIKSSKCPIERNISFFKVKNNDTIFKLNTKQVKKGYIVDVDSIYFSEDTYIFILKIDTINDWSNQFVINKMDTIKHEKYPILNIIEQMPSFFGGEEAMYSFLGNYIKYPQEAKENNISGTVIITFVVETDGSLSEFEILKDLPGGLGDEAMRVVSLMPPWKPGKQNGVPVRVQFNLPIKFTLD